MLPSLRNVAVSAEPVTGVYTYTDLGPVSPHVQSSKCVQRAAAEITGNNSPVLPLISEGSFTSLVSSRSNKSHQRAKEFLKKDLQKHGVDSKKNQDLPKLLPSHSSKQIPALRTTQLQLNCSNKNSVGGWITHVTNPKIMLHQAGYAQEGGVTLPSMSASSLHTPGPRPRHHVQGLHSKRKLQLSLARNARGGDNIHTAGFTSPLAGGITLSNRYKAPYSDESSTAPYSKSHQGVIYPQPSVPSFDIDNPTNPPGSQVTILKFHRNYSGGKKESLVSRSSSSTFSSRQRSQDKMIVAPSPRRQADMRVKPADKPPLRKQLPAKGPVSMQVKKKVKKTAVLLRQPDPKQRLLRGRITDKMRNYSKDRKKGDEGNLVVEKKKGEPQYEHITEKRHFHQYNKNEAQDKEEEMEVDEEQVQRVEEQKEAQNTPVALNVISLASPKPILDRTRTPNLLKVSKDLLSRVLDVDQLSQLFRKLDSNGDGHISFEELKRSFPTQITREQVYYLKKIYDMACESTYFGLEEFLGVQLMCKVITESSSVLSDIYSRMDLAKVETRFQTYTDLFTEADTKQIGVISVPLLQNVLGAALNVHTDSFIVQRVISVMKKSPSDLVFSAEFLVFLPYFVSTELQGS